jgi:hypothetical protein
MSKLYKRALDRQYSVSKTMSTNKIAVCQMTSVADKGENMNVVSKLIHDASQDGAQVYYLFK